MNTARGEKRHVYLTWLALDRLGYAVFAMEVEARRESKGASFSSPLSGMSCPSLPAAGDKDSTSNPDAKRSSERAFPLRSIE